MAEVYGDLAAAERTAVIVPGSDIDLSSFDRARDPYGTPAGMARSLRTRLAADAPQARTAVIAWAGYTTPVGIAPDATTGRLADAGAPRLARFLSGLAAVGAPAPAVLCHSYGSVVCGLAVPRLDGGGIADLVVFGSPVSAGTTWRSCTPRPGSGRHGTPPTGSATSRTSNCWAWATARIPPTPPSAPAGSPPSGPWATPAISPPVRTPSATSPPSCWAATAPCTDTDAPVRRPPTHAGRPGRPFLPRPLRRSSPHRSKDSRTPHGHRFPRALTGAARTTVRTIEDRTPADRDRALDGLRALALVAVPVGHWLIEGFTRDADGGLHNASLLTAFGALSPASWVLQMLGIFFLVGGHASVLSLRRATERGSPPALGCAAGSPGWAARCSG